MGYTPYAKGSLEHLKDAMHYLSRNSLDEQSILNLRKQEFAGNGRRNTISTEYRRNHRGRGTGPARSNRGDRKPIGGKGSYDNVSLMRELQRAQFHKTRMCPYLNRGTCRKGSECNYAHSDTELKPSVNLTKTKLCQDFTRNFCSRGSRCPFAHGALELRSTEGFYKSQICKFWLAGSCPAGPLCRHAHGDDRRLTLGTLGTRAVDLAPESVPEFKPQPALVPTIYSANKRHDRNIRLDGSMRHGRSTRHDRNLERDVPHDRTEWQPSEHAFCADDAGSPTALPSSVSGSGEIVSVASPRIETCYDGTTQTSLEARREGSFYASNEVGTTECKIYQGSEATSHLTQGTTGTGVDNFDRRRLSVPNHQGNMCPILTCPIYFVSQASLTPTMAGCPQHIPSPEGPPQVLAHAATLPNYPASYFSHPPIPTNAFYYISAVPVPPTEGHHMKRPEVSTPTTAAPSTPSDSASSYNLSTGWSFESLPVDSNSLALFPPNLSGNVYASPHCPHFGWVTS